MNNVCGVLLQAVGWQKPWKGDYKHLERKRIQILFFLSIRDIPFIPIYPQICSSLSRHNFYFWSMYLLPQKSMSLFRFCSRASGIVLGRFIFSCRAISCLGEGHIRVVYLKEDKKYEGRREDISPNKDPFNCWIEGAVDKYTTWLSKYYACQWELTGLYLLI